MAGSKGWVGGIQNSSHPTVRKLAQVRKGTEKRMASVKENHRLNVFLCWKGALVENDTYLGERN